MEQVKLKRPSKSTEEKFWREWLKTSIRLGEQTLFAWLPKSMEEEEIEALRQAATKLNCKVNINSKGFGEVTL